MKRRISAILVTVMMTICSVMLPGGDSVSEWMLSLNRVEAYENVEEYPDFSMDMYVADLMTDSVRNDFSYQMLSSYVNEYDSPNTIIFEPLRDNSSFQNSVSAWITVNAIFEPGESVAKTLDEEGYYEAIILNALNSAFQSENFYTGYIKKTYSVVNSTYSYFEDNSDLVYYLENYKKLTSTEVNDFGEALKDSFEKNHPNLDIISDSMGYLQDLFMICDTAYDFIEKLVSYSMCSEMTDEMKALVHTLHNTCNGRENPAMKLALSNIATACDSYALAMGEAFADVSFKASVKTMTKIGDDFMKSCIAYFPAGKAVLLTYAITKSAVNFILSTDKIIEQYYKMERLYKFEELLRSVLRSQMTNYQASPSEDNAKLLFAAVDVFFKTYNISCQYATDYAKILFEENLIGRYFGNTNQYNDLTKSIRHIRSSASLEHEWIRYHYYLSALEQEYPDIYAAYSEQTGSVSPLVINTLSVEFEKESIEVGLEDDFASVEASVLPADATNREIFYTSLNPEIAECTDYGTIYPIAVGTATIQATTVNGGYTATITVNVVEGHGADGTYLDHTLIGTAEVGDTFEVGGLTYEVTSETEVSVTDCDTEISGHLYIPENVGYYGGMYEVVSIGKETFKYCSELISIEMPDSVKSISNFLFGGNDALTTLTLGNGVIEMGSWALHNSGIRKLIFSDGITEINSNMTNYIENTLEEVTIPDSVITIGDYTFDSCSKINSVYLPNSVKTIGVGCFYNCIGLEDVYLSNGLETIGENAFYGCENLVQINLPESVSYIGNGAFRNCKNSSIINLPDSVSYMGGEFVFYGCSEVREIILPFGMEAIGKGMFSGCTKLVEVDIPDSVKTIEAGPYSDEDPFYNCESITKIEIPNSVTTVNAFSFSYCTNLTCVTIGNGVESFHSQAFWASGDVKKLIFTEGITTINSGMTSYIETSLEEVVIPDSVTTIGNSTFYNCTALTDVYFLGSEMEWNEIAIGTSNNSLDTATIHFNYVPPQGDVNLDGSFNVADLVSMQRYLLADGSLTYWRAGDMDENNMLDVFDLILMRTLIVS